MSHNIFGIMTSQRSIHHFGVRLRGAALQPKQFNWVAANDFSQQACLAVMSCESQKKTSLRIIVLYIYIGPYSHPLE